MPCDGGGGGYRGKYREAIQARENVENLYKWFIDTIKRPELHDIPGLSNYDEVIWKNTDKIFLENLETRNYASKLCHCIRVVGEEAFYKFLTGLGFEDENASKIAVWYAEHKEYDKKRNKN